MFSVLIAVLTCVGWQDATPVDSALEAFAGAPDELQQSIIQEIERKIQESESPELKRLVDLGKEADRKLKRVDAPEPHFYDPAVYARGLVTRSWAGEDDEQHRFFQTVFQPLKNEPPFFLQVQYDFADDVGWHRATAPSARDRLWNYLNGYMPGADLLVAYASKQLDFEKRFDVAADHFAHAYCDLEGVAYSRVTLYDALASGEGIDMPDVDVIAYARRILRDRSYVSPIPASARRQKLYDEVKKGFLEYYQHRTWVEEASVLYLNPWAELRSEHEPIRERLLYAIALDEGDLSQLRKRFQKAGSRDRFIKQIDKAYLEDDGYQLRISELRQDRSRALWAVAIAAQEVLRVHGFLKD